MEKIYVRFGEIPTDEQSEIWCGDVKIGKEKGVSVYEALQDDNGKINILMPKLTYSACVSLSGCIERKSYIITGELVGMGSDAEPLLRNCKLLKEINLIPLKP